MRYVYIYCYYSLLLSWESYHWDRFANYSLFLSWGSRCRDRFAIYSFAKLWVPAGTRQIMQPLAGSLLASMVLGEGFQVHIHPRDEHGFEKIGPEWITFPFTNLLSLNILRQYWAQRTVSPEGIK